VVKKIKDNANRSRYLNGLPLEKQFNFWAEHKLNLSTQHNNFEIDKYPFEHSLVVDSKIGTKVLVEMTNPKSTTFMGDNIMLEKLDYFKRADPAHKLIWVLLVSFAVFSQYIFEQIEKLNIHLIVLNVHADRSTQHSMTNALYRSKLWRLIKQVFNPKRKTSQFLGNKLLQTNLSNTVNTASVNNTVKSTKSNTVSHCLYQHTIDSNLMQDKQDDTDNADFVWRNGLKVPIINAVELSG
jgi:hypothetical protein